ncbi:hypothetical protein ATG_17480 [Desulfurococcaceae archaeon AG1]|nr:hypothetical protein ATG_17480 [Desulfurococcaceae archaeon AG1]
MADLNLALDYLNRLKRKFGIRAVISEYPSIPIVFYCLNIGYLIPGYTGFAPDTPPFFVDAESIGIDAGSNITTYKYRLRVQNVVTGAYVIQIYVEETRGAYDYLFIKPENVDPNYTNCDMYFAGQYLGKVSAPTAISLAPGDTFPSMRTAVRHVDELSGLMKYWGYTDYQDVYIWAKELIAAATRGYYSGVLDIYGPIGKDLGSSGEIVIQVSEDHFWDAKYWNGILGHQTLLEMFKTYNLIENPYPLYPYKSKIVGATERTGNGPWWFLTLLSQCGDPLLDAWWGLYYAAIDDWANAKSKWDALASKWDGVGLQPSNSACRGSGYSTIRLAAALALGTMLAKRGYIPWTTVDSMYGVLDQLQWQGSGYYSPDGSTVYTIYKPDHRGGFIVSYNKVGSYGFVPFRPSLIEDILKEWSSPPEYGGVLPTNSETTITSMIALRLYRSFRS